VLQTAQQLLFLALGEDKVIVCELRVLLFEFSFNFVPVAFDLEFSHAILSQLGALADARQHRDGSDLPYPVLLCPVIANNSLCFD
jgi:hypothetical protein